MTEPITFLHMNHINAVVDDFDSSVSHFRDVYGAQMISDMPRPEWHACLLTIGTVIFELFAPHDDLLHARFGPHYVGVEYQVPDVGKAREEVLARGMRVVRELDVAFHAHPLDGLGVSFEFYDRSFHDEPPPTPFLEPIKPLGYWRDHHPLGCTGLERYSIVVADLEAARRFFGDFTDATQVYESPRPAIGAKCVGLALGDTTVELLAPTDSGPVALHLARHGEGIRSTVFSVRDLGQAQSYFSGLGVTLRPGDSPDSLAIAPEDNRGLLFEFSEQVAT